MKAFTKSAVFLLIIFSVLAGCSTVPRGEEVEVTYMGPINASNNTFEMDGYLSTGGGIPDRETFRNVKIQSYAENGTVLCGVEVGNLTADHGRHNVSVTANAVPEYVLVTSPDFWTEQIKVSYFQRGSNSQGYDREHAYSKAEFPISVVESDHPSCSA